MYLCKRKTIVFILCMVLLLSFLCGQKSDAAGLFGEDKNGNYVLKKYNLYMERFEQIKEVQDLTKNNYRVFEDQIFTYVMESFGEDEVYIIPAIERTYHRFAIFIADLDGKILYKTNQLKTNNLVLGQMEQPGFGIASIAFADLDGDEKTDIVLITKCVNSNGEYGGKSYKVGDVLFQGDKCFYSDYRISDKINRFDMNKSANCIISYVRDKQSIEYLYTAGTLDELIKNGFNTFGEHLGYARNFEKLGRLRVIPGSARISQYEIFMVYLVDESGNIVWSFQPMGDYENLYSLKGVSSGRDLDGDGLTDIMILAKYSYEESQGKRGIASVCSIYYQRTGGFDTENDFQKTYQYTGKETMTEMIKKVREYWGWRID